MFPPSTRTPHLSTAVTLRCTPSARRVRYSTREGLAGDYRNNNQSQQCLVEKTTTKQRHLYGLHRLTADRRRGVRWHSGFSHLGRVQAARLEMRGNNLYSVCTCVSHYTRQTLTNRWTLMDKHNLHIIYKAQGSNLKRKRKQSKTTNDISNETEDELGMSFHCCTKLEKAKLFTKKHIWYHNMSTWC